YRDRLPVIPPWAMDGPRLLGGEFRMPPLTEVMTADGTYQTVPALLNNTSGNTESDQPMFLLFGPTNYPYRLLTAADAYLLFQSCVIVDINSAINNAALDPSFLTTVAGSQQNTTAILDILSNPATLTMLAQSLQMQEAINAPWNNSQVPLQFL